MENNISQINKISSDLEVALKEFMVLEGELKIILDSKLSQQEKAVQIKDIETRYAKVHAKIKLLKQQSAELKNNSNSNNDNSNEN